MNLKSRRTISPLPPAERYRITILAKLRQIFRCYPNGASIEGDSGVNSVGPSAVM